MLLPELKKGLTRQKMFDSMDLKSPEVTTFNEWYKFSIEPIFAKTTPLDPTPSSTTEPWSCSRHSIRLCLLLAALKMMSSDSMLWSSSLSMTMTRMVFSP